MLDALLYTDALLRGGWQYSPLDGRRTSRGKGAQSARSSKQQRKEEFEGARPSSRIGRKGQRKALRTQGFQALNNYSFGCPLHKSFSFSHGYPITYADVGNLALGLAVACRWPRKQCWEEMVFFIARHRPERCLAIYPNTDYPWYFLLLQ